MARSRSNSTPQTPVYEANEKGENTHQENTHRLEDVDLRHMTAQEIAAAKPEDLMHVDGAQAAELRRQLAASQQGGWRPVTEEEKRLDMKLNWKLDLMILPFLALGYMFSSLDRTNLGNAETAGFSSDIGVAGHVVNDASSLFYVTYIPLQPLATAAARRVGAPRFMAACLILWGVLTICHAFVKNEAQLIAVRMLMGLGECGFYPTGLAYLADFYPRYYIAFRYSLYYSMIAVSGAFGGLIAYGVLQLKTNLHNWQYLFIIEGAVPVALGLAAPFLLSDTIQTTWFLSEEERSFATRRMALDSSANISGQRKVTRRDFIEAISDWRVLTNVLANLLATLSSSGFSIFFPLVIKGLGYSGTKANLMTVPPYCVGAVIVWVTCWLSDRTQQRANYLLGGMFVCILGFILAIVIPSGNLNGRYAAMVVLQAGAFVHGPLSVAWLSGNTPEPGKRSVALGVAGYCNVAGIIGTQLFKPQYSPSYRLPLIVTTVLLALGFLMFAGCGISLHLVNRWRARKLAQMTPEEIEEENMSDTRVGDKKWTFVYGL